MVKIPVGWLLGTQASTEWLTQACLPPTAFWSSSLGCVCVCVLACSRVT